MKIGTSGTGKPTGALKRAYDLMVELGRTKKNKPEQGTFCYCPRCKTELISSGSFVSDEELVTYKCSLCDTVTEWLFDAPAPILWTVDGEDVDYRPKEETR